jgi:hypothetical protein
MQNSKIEEAQFRQSPSAGLLYLPVRWSAIISVAARQRSAHLC